MAGNGVPYCIIERKATERSAPPSQTEDGVLARLVKAIRTYDKNRQASSTTTDRLWLRM